MEDDPISNEQLIKLIKERDLEWQILEEIADWDIQEEASNRGLSISYDLDNYSDEEIITEAESRNYMLIDSDLRRIIDIIFQQKRTGKPFNTELDRLIYEITGRFI